VVLRVLFFSSLLCLRVRSAALLVAETNCAAKTTHQLMLSMSEAPRRPSPNWWTTK